VREERGQGLDSGIVSSKAERERGYGGTVKIEPALGDQRDRKR
jgi:hypothetical protein